MKSIKRLITGVVAAVGLAGGGFLALAPAASADDVSAAQVCGYYSSGQYHYYNHCGSGNAYIQIDQVVGSYSQCVTPGVTMLRNSSGGLFSITNAFYLRSC